MLTAHEIFGFMSPALATGIIDYLFENEREVYKATLQAVAEAKKVRSVFIERKPRAQRNQEIAQMLGKQRLDAVAGNLLRAWLLKKNKSMLVDYLDTLQIPHTDAAVDSLPPEMDEARLTEAVEKLLGKYPREEVAVYLNAFYSMNEVNWPNLKSRLESDPRLQLG